MTEHNVSRSTRPPSLRAFVDAECDLMAADIEPHCLAEALHDATLLRTTAERSRLAQVYRGAADALLDHLAGHPDARWWRTAVLSQWTAECLEDPALAVRVRAALLAADAIGWRS